jgi:hypothetical protein
MLSKKIYENIQEKFCTYLNLLDATANTQPIKETLNAAFNYISDDVTKSAKYLAGMN